MQTDNHSTPKAIPVVSIVGKSESGKTTLIERIIPELIRAGWRVATIKHSRRGFDIDREGKDSWRHRKAGAHMTVMASPGQIAVIEDADRELEIAELRDRYIHDADLVLSEGFKGNPYPKIEVFRSGLKRELLCSREDNLIAVASDVTLDIDVPCFDINDSQGIARLIIDQFLPSPQEEHTNV